MNSAADLLVVVQFIDDGASFHLLFHLQIGTFSLAYASVEYGALELILTEFLDVLLKLVVGSVVLPPIRLHKDLLSFLLAVLQFHGLVAAKPENLLAYV